jgi:hypothetical protein
MKQQYYLYGDPFDETQTNRRMHYPFGTKLKHGQRTEALEGFHG